MVRRQRGLLYQLKIILFFIFVIISQGTYFHCLGSTGKAISECSELIVVFPGESQRIEEGFELARSGYAANIAIPGRSLNTLQSLALQHGLDDRVGFIPMGHSQTTFEDALLTRRVVKEHGFSSIMLVTSSYHLPRAYFLLRVLLTGCDVTIQTHGVPDEDARQRTSHDRFHRPKIFFNEMIKFWASLGEMAWYGLTGRLLTELQSAQVIRRILKEWVLFAV